MALQSVVKGGLAVLACLGALAAAAQSDPLAAIDRVQGEARTRALVEGARKEGELMVYHSTQAEDLKPVFDAFTRKYGIAVKDWRSSSENIVQRVISQTRATLVASGEIPLALTVYNYKPQQLKEKGAKIDWVVLAPAVAQLHAVAVHAKAPHPHAAALLYDFFLGEGQALLAARSFVPSNSKVPSPMGETPIRAIDPAEAIDKQDAWLKVFQETFIRRR